MVGGGVGSAKGGVPLLAGDFDSDVAAGGELHFGSVRRWSGVPVEEPPRYRHAVERLVDAGVGAVEAVHGRVEDPDVRHCGGN